MLQMRKRREFLKIKREEAKQDEGVQVAIPAPDPPLPPNFDADTNTHRYRFLEAPGGWLARCALHHHPGHKSTQHSIGRCLSTHSNMMGYLLTHRAALQSFSCAQAVCGAHWLGPR